MKKYLVIGNPIEHSLSPKLHNYWIKENNINAIYDKKKLNEKMQRSRLDRLAGQVFVGRSTSSSSSTWYQYPVLCSLIASGW